MRCDARRASGRRGAEFRRGTLSGCDDDTDMNNDHGVYEQVRDFMQ
ncbi:hypothetical protein ACFYSF_25440 [Streptomyces canus]